MRRIQHPQTSSYHHQRQDSSGSNQAAQSKCSTPKKKKHRTYQHQPASQEQESESNEKTEHKTNKLFGSRRGEGVGFEKIMQNKVNNYEIIAGTLREYIKQQEKKCASRRKYLGTVKSIIKAYARSQIHEISPSVTLLIQKILDTLPQKQGSRKSNPRTRPKQKLKQHDIMTESTGNKKVKHNRQFSFSHKKEQTLQNQIEELQQNLLDLRKQSRMLQEIKQEYEEMEYNDKLEYIAELEEVVRKQKQIIDNIPQY